MTKNNSFPEENKMTETELGSFPIDWNEKKLSKVFDFSKKPRGLNIKDSDDIPFIPMESISEYSKKLKGWTIKKYKEISSGFFVFKGDLLIAKITPCFENGKQAILDNLPSKYGYATTEVWAIHPKNNVADKEYLFYYLKISSVRKKLAQKMEGTTGRQRLPRHVLENLLIPFPPLPEQKKIAGVLSAVQEAKEKTEEVIKAEKELKKSLMKHLFTYGPMSIEEAEKVKLRETAIGMLPEEWKEISIKELVKKTTQKDPKKTLMLKFKYIDVSSISRENLKIIEYKIYEGKNAPSRARKLVEKDDVIFATVRPTLKRIAIINSEFSGEICSTAFCVLRVKKDFINPRYLFYTIQRDIFVEELGKIQRGASYPAVTDSDIKGQKIPLPPLYTQQKIVDILSSVDNKIETEENKKKALEELFKTLLNNLMTGKIRVHNLDIEV